MGVYSTLYRNDVIHHYELLLETFNLTNKDIWLSSGAAMVLHGLRTTTSDLDTGCSSAIFERISKQLKQKSIPFPDSVVFCKEESLSLPLEEYFTDFYTENNIKEEDLVLIDGVSCYSPTYLLEQKIRMLSLPGRKPTKLSQDRNDIFALRELINL